MAATSKLLATWIAATATLAACSSDPSDSSGKTSNTSGKGASTFNAALCDPAGGWHSAVRSATGPKDGTALAQFAATLQTSGYRATYHPGLFAADASASDVEADAGGSDPDATELDATADAGGNSADVGLAKDATGKDVGTTAAVDNRPYVIALDQRNDAVVLMNTGDLYVASACALDRLGQMRRLDFGLADAARLLTALDHPGDWQLETERWARPATIYTEAAGQYWRQYLDDAASLQKPVQGSLSLTGAPLGLAMGMYGHADTPSAVGDVVRLNSLKVAGKVLASGETWPVSQLASLVWDLAAVMAAGELPFRADLLVADASVEWHVGVYHVFFEALFGNGGQGLGVTMQGSLPGALRVSHALSELDLPAAPTES
jgi:hypothetical protein